MSEIINNNINSNISNNINATYTPNINFEQIYIPNNILRFNKYGELPSGSGLNLTSFIKEIIASSVTVDTNLGNTDLVLTDSRDVDGDNNSLSMYNFSLFEVASLGSLLLNAQDSSNLQANNNVTITSGANLILAAPHTSIEGNSTLHISTANTTNGDSFANDVLTLLDPVTGECDWQPSTGGTNIYNSDGILTATRVVDCNDEELSFNNFKNIFFSSFTPNNTVMIGSGNVSASGSAISLQGSDTVQILSDNTIHIRDGQTTSAAIGDILTLIDSNTGECTWQTSNSHNFANADLIFDGDRVHDAAGYSLDMNNIKILTLNTETYIINSVSNFNINSNDVDFQTLGTTTINSTASNNLISNGLFLIPSTTTIASKSNGDVLKLIDNTTGECDWSTPTAPTRVLALNTASTYTTTGSEDIVRNTASVNSTINITASAIEGRELTLINATVNTMTLNVSYERIQGGTANTVSTQSAIKLHYRAGTWYQTI